MNIISQFIRLLTLYLDERQQGVSKLSSSLEDALYCIPFKHFKQWRFFYEEKEEEEELKAYLRIFQDFNYREYEGKRKRKY